MIEEIKELLTLIEKLPSMAMWVLGGFAIYKLIVYLSSTGAIVMILRLLINKLYDAYTAPRAPKAFRNGILIDDLSTDSLSELLKTVKEPGLTYVHASDIAKLERAWQFYQANKDKKGVRS